MRKELYITNSESFRIAYGLDIIALVMSQDDGNPLSKHLMDELAYSPDMERALEPERVLGIYRTTTGGVSAIMTEDGFSQFPSRQTSRGFDRDLLRSYISECEESDKVVITESRELSELVETLATDLDLKPVRF